MKVSFSAELNINLAFILFETYEIVTYFQKTIVRHTNFPSYFDCLYIINHTCSYHSDTTKPIISGPENMNIIFILFENSKPKTFPPKNDDFLTLPLKIHIFDSLYIHNHTSVYRSETIFPIISSMENLIMIFAKIIEFK